MAEQDPQGKQEKPKPKAERKQIEYAVIGAIGPKDANVQTLSYHMIGKVKATTPGAAKEALLQENPEFPWADNYQPAEAEAGKPMDLQSLVKREMLWLEAKSNWAPRPVIVEQPPPKFSGL
jgi:hypothetical protein